MEAAVETADYPFEVRRTAELSWLQRRCIKIAFSGGAM
jgi:hypothetical protein